ncbi:MAG: tRNA (guanosine(37)-N1)-methyltransferase TrmD [Spirochaetaceae bacterium]|jgi:tRNA (guanine37-N1)-methyltransferase|nr:tRNA (guanosine(37)-N1)-methyltransferase TrmD [Spirochaetaceae bacterium]
MKYTVLSLFPEIIESYFAVSLMARAVDRALVEYRLIDIRDFALDKHKTCDDAPYGGGAGMLMLAEPAARALESAGVTGKQLASPPPDASSKRVVYLAPSGKPFTQQLAAELAAEQELVLLCGRYEGLDQRVIDRYVDDEVSVGDYVLSSGEVAALCIIDATYRLLDSVIKPASLTEESFSGGLLEYPQWTRPEIFDGMPVPDILLSGHHEKIRLWRLRKRVEKTLAIRPDLINTGLARNDFDAETKKIIMETMENQSLTAGAAPKGIAD